MTRPPLHGIVPIVLTPFHQDGAIDEESLERLIDFNIGAGVNALGVALGSEMFKLDEAERDQLTRAVVRIVAGRVPVIINTGAAGTDLAVRQSKLAEKAGADALMIIPPFFFVPPSPAEIIDYYRAIDRAVGIPIILQDVPQAPIPPALAAQIADRCPRVRSIKVETAPIVGQVAAMTAAIGDRLGVFGGAGGGYFIEEMRRGAIGTMSFCSQPADFVAVWNAFRAGDEAAARARFDQTLMPTFRLGMQGGDLFYHLHKRLLVRLGVIRTAHVRPPTTPIDPVTAREIDDLITQLAPQPTDFST